MNVFARELQYFRVLNPAARDLIISFVAFNIASPLIGIFTNAYIWRQTHDLESVAIFNGAWIVGVIAAFIFNGYLLRWVSLSKLYAASLFLLSSSTLLLFAVESLTTGTLVAIAMFLGFFSGSYWSNRNVLTVQVTSSSERDYFCCVESSSAMLLASVSPFVFGWFLQFGEYVGVIGVFHRYQVLMALVLVVQAIGTLAILRTNFADVTPRQVLLRRPSRGWRTVRKFIFLKGIADGTLVIFPSLLILYVMGAEGALGAVQSGAVILSSGVLYYLARRMRFESRYFVLALGVALVVVGGLAISVLFNKIGVVIYTCFDTLGVQVLWAAANPIVFDAIGCDADLTDDHYAYVVDREFYLNFGRLVGFVVFVALVRIAGNEVGLRVAPLILGSSAALLLVCARSIVSVPLRSEGAVSS